VKRYHLLSDVSSDADIEDAMGFCFLKSNNALGELL
jgi:hypothetical protein